MLYVLHKSGVLTINGVAKKSGDVVDVAPHLAREWLDRDQGLMSPADAIAGQPAMPPLPPSEDLTERPPGRRPR